MAELRIIKMSDIQPEPIEWLWEPYIPYGAVSLMQGDGGTGKTTTALAIAAAVTRGGALPGGCTTTTPGSVIIQNAEDSYAQTIRPRLEQFGADCGMIHVIDEDEQALSLADGRIEQSIIETGAKLVVLDPVQAYIGNANMNSAGGVRPLMKQLGAVASRNGCAILLVGHLSKKGTQAQYRGLGSIDIYAAARSVLTVGRVDAEDDMRVIVHNKSNLSRAGSPQAFGLDPVDGFRWLGDYDITIEEVLSGKKKPESQFDKARKLIGAALAGGPAPAAAIMQAAEDDGVSLKTLNRAKDAMGVISIKRGERWYWELPVEVVYTEVKQDGQHGQDTDSGDAGQVNSVTNMTALAVLQEVV
jgi:hypothetical protein